MDRVGGPPLCIFNQKHKILNLPIHQKSFISQCFHHLSGDVRYNFQVFGLREEMLKRTPEKQIMGV